jgi:hypothetical protein
MGGLVKRAGVVGSSAMAQVLLPALKVDYNGDVVQQEVDVTALSRLEVQPGVTAPSKVESLPAAFLATTDYSLKGCNGQLKAICEVAQAKGSNVAENDRSYAYVLGGKSMEDLKQAYDENMPKDEAGNPAPKSHPFRGAVLIADPEKKFAAQYLATTGNGCLQNVGGIDYYQRMQVAMEGRVIKEVIDYTATIAPAEIVKGQIS